MCCSLTKNPVARTSTQPKKKQRKRVNPLPPPPPQPNTHPDAPIPSANQVQPLFQTVIKKRKLFLFTSTLALAVVFLAFPPFGPWFRQRNLKRFPFRGFTRGSPLSWYQASLPRPNLAHPPSSLLFTVPLRIGSLVTKQCSHETLAHFGSQG